MSTHTNMCIDCGTSITRYSRGRCVECGGKARMRGVPADFIEVLRARGSAGAAKHYRSSLGTVTRWRRQMSLTPFVPAKKPVRTVSGAGSFMGYRRPIFVNRDLSRVGQAADFLRKYGAVYRCGPRGNPQPKGEFWNRNGHVLTDDEIISRASRLGWSFIA